MAYFVDTNQHKVCTHCGHRWTSSLDWCKKCDAEVTLGGQILPPEPAPEPKVTAAPKKAKKTSED